MFITHRKAFHSCTSFAFFLCAFLGTAFLFAGEDWQPQVIGPFGTLNNRDNTFAIPAQNAQDLLNVNITQGGKSVLKRKGFATAFSLTNTTSPVHGVYNFFDSQGNDVSLFFNDTYLSSSINGTGPNTVFSNGPNGATYQCTDNLGFAYCANTARTTLIKTNGVTSSNINNVASTGTTVATCVTRLAMAGFSDRPSAIDFSADSDFTTWGTGSLGNSPVQLTISAPGSRITHLVYAFGRLIWFKDSSFGYVIIGNQPLQTDWVIRTISFDVGTNDNTSVFREGILYFRGQDGHIYGFDGSNYQRISREISGTIGLSQSRIGGSWTQTTQSDFQSGASIPPGWISTGTIPGSLVLQSTSANSPFIDTSAADFGAANTFTNVDTTTFAGSVILTSGSVIGRDNYYPAGATESQINTCSGSARWVAQSFTSTSGYVATSVVLRLMREGTIDFHRVSIYSDNASSPATLLGFTLINNADVTTSTTDITVSLPNISLANATTYWVRIDAPASCSNNLANLHRILWFEDSVGTLRGITKTDSGSTFTTTNQKFQLSGRSYPSSGSILSRTFDMGFTTNTWMWSWRNFYSSGTIPSHSTMTYETQVSSSATGVFDSLISVASGSLITSQVKEFIRYKVSFTTDGSTSPILTDVLIYASPMLRPMATFYSQVKNAPALTAWDTFSANSVLAGGSISFNIRSSTNPITVLSSTPAWTSVNSGAIPSLSTGTYFQINAIFSVTNSTQNPSLNDFTQNWFEGIATDKSYAIYFDDKIWWEVTGGTGATTNNRTLVYDLLNQGWTLYDLANNGFYVRQAKLYFGSSSGGYIYKFGVTDNDNGAPISAFWKSKDFFGDNPFTYDELANISIAAKEVANSTMTLTYTLDGSSVSSFSFPLYSATNLMINKNRNLAASTIANTYSIQFGNNAADQPFEVFAVQVGVRPKSWIPTQ